MIAQPGFASCRAGPGLSRAGLRTTGRSVTPGCSVPRRTPVTPAAGGPMSPCSPGRDWSSGTRSFQLMSRQTITGHGAAGRAGPRACHDTHGYDSPLTWPASGTVLSAGAPGLSADGTVLSAGAPGVVSGTTYGIRLCPRVNTCPPFQARLQVIP